MIAAGEGCLETDCTGRLYKMEAPRKLIRITGLAPICACVYELDRWRCNLCGMIYTAPPPPQAGDQKYDESVAAMVAMLKYGAGLPFYRLEKLQAALAMPCPASTQWDLVKNASDKAAPAHEVLLDAAADGEVVYNDDTTQRVLGITPQQRAEAISDDEDGKRTGIYTSGIVSTKEGRRIAVFMTGVRHAGENLAEVLKRRDVLLPVPIQMCDASSNNTPHTFETILCRCLSHSRRRYIDVAESFPAEVAYVLNILKEVYATDAKAKELNLSAAERLGLHRQESGPRMAQLKAWIEAQIEEGMVEENSTLGDALQYMRSHWAGLTQFLRTENAPLDNNLCEQAIKRVVLFRKNSLFYRTVKGAAVGDRFMTLIHTCELNGVNPFEYLVAILRHADAVAQNPKRWLPWNYKDALMIAGAVGGALIEGSSPSADPNAAAFSVVPADSTRCHSNGALA
jgi:transposase